MLLNAIFSTIGLAGSLYGIFTSAERLCSKADKMVDSKLDIWTENQVLGSDDITIQLRSKSERRLVRKYNQVIIKCMNLRFKKVYPNWETKTDWERGEISFLFRLHTALTLWWSSGFAGQYFDGNPELDPRVLKVFKKLSPEDRAVITQAQILISARGKERMS